jgi:flagellar basal body rod protein FlgG
MKIKIAHNVKDQETQAYKDKKAKYDEYMRRAMTEKSEDKARYWIRRAAKVVTGSFKSW